MKAIILCFIFTGIAIVISAQDITISFQPKVSGTTIDSIIVSNQRTTQKVKLLGNESLTLTNVTGILNLSFPYAEGYLFPNPCKGETQLCFTTALNQVIKLNVNSISGKLLSTKSQLLSTGLHRFNLVFPEAGIYNITILKDDGSLSFKTVCIGKGINRNGIEYLGSESIYHSKSAAIGKTLNYTQGDILLHSVFSGKNNTIISDSPTATREYSVEFFDCIDQEKRNYPIVRIGNQWWMAKNLVTTKYNDGSSIANVTGNTDWSILTTGAYCWYKTDTVVISLYGGLYNWHAVNTGKLCPEGWHVPSNEEWIALITYLGGESIAGGKMKQSGTTYWLSPNTGATNESGFTALPGGQRDADGTIYTMKDHGLFWSSTKFTNVTNIAFCVTLTETNVSIFRMGREINCGFSIRCVRNI